MSKRSLYTVITPLPPTVTRTLAVNMLHSHGEMIELGPYVIEHHEVKPPKDAPADEFHCSWQSITDRLSYLPGNLATGKVTYNVCFHNLPYGMQSHCYAPMGLHIRSKWTVAGNMPGEPREVMEIGVTRAPREGLYLREDVDIKCNIFVTGYVKKTLKKAHEVLVDRMLKKGEIIEDNRQRMEFSQRPIDYRNSTYKPPLTANSAPVPPDSSALPPNSSPIPPSSFPPPPAYALPDLLKPGMPARSDQAGLPAHFRQASLAGHTHQSGPAELPAEEAADSSSMGPSARSSMAPTHYELASPIVSPMASPSFNQSSFPRRYSSYHQDPGLGYNS